MSVSAPWLHARNSLLLVQGGFLWFALVGCGDVVEAQSICQPGTGLVTRIVDGDTIELDPSPAGDQPDARVIVRYLLVDAPETAAEGAGECFADDAVTLNRSWVLNKHVSLNYDADDCTDMFGRQLAYVTVGGRMINEVLLERGYARYLHVSRASHLPPYEQAEHFSALEASAREVRAGLWGVCE